MKKYQCFKEVQAMQISAISGRHLYGPNGVMTEPITVSEEYLARHKPEVGGYFVLYADGYQSFSPASAFETGYVEMKSVIGNFDLDWLFSYHKPTDEDLPKLAAIRAKAKEMARVILECTPQSADQTAAIRLLRDAVMTSNAAIMLKGSFLTPPNLKT